MKYASIITRAIVGGVLLYAGFMKAIGPSAEFAALISAYKILPAALIGPFAIGLPYVEMWVGLFLLFGFYTRQASVATLVLISSFSMALLSSLLRGIDLVSCGCFGADSLSPRYTIVLDMILLVLSIVSYRQSKIPPAYSLDKVLP